MKLLLMTVFIFSSLSQAFELGTITTGSKIGMYYKLGNDLSSILKKYDMNLEVITSAGSYENIDILNGNYIKDKNTYFGIVQKDAISYYNYNQVLNGKESIYRKIPAILSLGTEDIHIIANKNRDFNFEERSKFNIYCGEYGGGSCITAKYIEEAYGFEFVYVNSTKSTILSKLKNNKIDLYFMVIQKPSTLLKDEKEIKLLSLPDNLVMNKMYEKSSFTVEDYSWQEEEVSSYLVQKVLVTNITDKKYHPILNNIVNIIINNKEYLYNNYGVRWDNVNFKYVNFKYMPENIKKILLNSK